MQDKVNCTNCFSVLFIYRAWEYAWQRWPWTWGTKLWCT